jgi:beta-lactamase regulating signal transducer with metallopeptidase domain
MIPFVIKSAICLTILYGFYHLVLRNVKVFDFNRYYLLFSLLFAIVTPLITIRVSLNLPVNSNIQKVSNVSGNFIQADKIITEPVQYSTFQNIVFIIYLIASFILLLRFALNIIKIIQQIRAGLIINTNSTHIILIENKTLPYSFFKYIFVNRSDYENGKIEKGLILHEQTHCLQYHSADILLIELLKIVLWFNPILWLFRKAIQLNHEFLADNHVLSTQSLSDYQNTLINHVFRSNSTYLASNFNYSLTKKRLIMTTKNNSIRKAICIKIATIPVFLILAISLTFAQENKSGKSDLKAENEWWYPFMKKHGFDLDKSEWTPLLPDIMIKAHENNNNLYKDIKAAYNQGDTTIFIVEAPKAIFDKKKNSYEFSNGKTFRYWKNGDYEWGEFKTMKLQFPKNKQKTSTEVQNTSFQQKLAGERKSAEEEQTDAFQKKLADERTAAVEGTIVMGQKEKNK